MKILLGGLCLWGASAFGDVIITDLIAKPPVSIHLEGKSADRIVDRFNFLKWNGTAGARCHHPAYRLQVREAGPSSIDATICFQCRNVLFKNPADYGLRGFTGDDASATALRESLAGLFKAPLAK